MFIVGGVGGWVRRGRVLGLVGCLFVYLFGEPRRCETREGGMGDGRPGEVEQGNTMASVMRANPLVLSGQCVGVCVSSPDVMIKKRGTARR